MVLAVRLIQLVHYQILEVEMRRIEGHLALIVSVVIEMVPVATLADTPPPDPAKAQECLYRDSHYGNGAIVCVAPQYGQRCTNGAWAPPTRDEGVDKICANAQVLVPGPTASQCLYHDAKYAPGALICAAPHTGLACNPDGGWSAAANLDKACANAQIPNPAVQPAK
jgi:hypothetical protein